MKITSPSKINIYLRVIRKRIDGYHEIETIFLPLENPSDTVTITDSEDGRLSVTCSDPSLSGPENLCHKAATAFAESAKIRPSWKIHIRKNIPVAAGLGGGSSDAASVLKLLWRKYPEIISDTEIMNLASKIGADVSFFLNPVPSLATGIGEKLKPFEFKCEIPVVVVFPKFPVSAKWAYQVGRFRRNRLFSTDGSESRPHLNSINKVKSNDIISAIQKNDLHKISSLLRNDLAPSLWKKFPLLYILRDSLSESGALGVQVSGSGSSLFAIAESEKSAEKIAGAMGKRFKDRISCHATVIRPYGKS